MERGFSVESAPREANAPVLASMEYIEMLLEP